MQGQKRMVQMIKDVLKRRLESAENSSGDLLDQLIKDMKTEKFVSEEFIVNILFGILFASSESISSATTLACKFLFDYPPALEELRVIFPFFYD